MTVGILGLQGAVQEHIPHLARCGAQFRVVRDKAGLARVARLIIPGGESTVMLKFLREFDMLALLKARIADGLPLWGICAGAIVLAEAIDGRPGPIGALPVDLTRNAYGRQIASRQHRLDIPLFEARAYPAIFIRAPRIVRVRTAVQVHAFLEHSESSTRGASACNESSRAHLRGSRDAQTQSAPPGARDEAQSTVWMSCEADPIFVQYGRLMATTFHPELNHDDRFHRYFLSI